MFILNQLYPRDDLKKFVGTKDTQSGILSQKGAKPKDVDYVILSTGGKHAAKVGYEDVKLSDGRWVYFGQGSVKIVKLE